MKTIAICNHKGGVGKTAASMALAEGLNAKGYRTLLVDLDQQTNATRQAGAKIEDAVTVYDLLTSFEYTAADGIQHYEHGDIIPGDTLVADAEVEMSKLDTPLTMLADALECVEGNYDYCVIDCPPSLGIVTRNAIVAADDVIVVVVPDTASVDGFGKVYQACEAIRKNKRLKATILLSMTKIEKEALQNLAKRSNVTVSELVRLALVYQAIDLPEAPLGNVGSLDKEEPRTNCIQVQVTDSEKLALRERAESLGCSMSDLVRRSAIQGKVVQQNEIDIEAVRRMTHELLKQGTNLNQLMYFLNANGIAAFDPAEVQQVIWNVRDAVRKATELTEMLKSQV